MREMMKLSLWKEIFFHIVRREALMKIEPIGYVESCFGEKFGTPRQSGLCPTAQAVIRLTGDFDHAQSLQGLEKFSHIWVIFHFHLIEKNNTSPTVRPPRLGGNTRVGVFASRSTHRFNSLGLSLCKIEKIEASCIYVSGHDLVNGTPVFDIKPYLSYAESIPDAQCSYAATAPNMLPVIVSAQAQAAFDLLEKNVQQTIREALAYDPRPAIHDDEQRIYGVHICEKNVSFQVSDVVTILNVTPIL